MRAKSATALMVLGAMTIATGVQAQALRQTVEELLREDATRAVEANKKRDEKEKEAASVSPSGKKEKGPVIVVPVKPNPVPRKEDVISVSSIIGTKGPEKTDLRAVVSINGRSRLMQIGDRFDSYTLRSIEAGCVTLHGSIFVPVEPEPETPGGAGSGAAKGAKARKAAPAVPVEAKPARPSTRQENFVRRSCVDDPVPQTSMENPRPAANASANAVPMGSLMPSPMYRPAVMPGQPARRPDPATNVEAPQ